MDGNRPEDEGAKKDRSAGKRIDRAEARPKRVEAGPRAPKRKEEQAANARLHRWAAWAAIVSAAVAVIGLPFVYLTFIKDDDPVSASGPGAPRLERIDLIARNGLPPQKPALELIVHNGGGGASVISRARIKVLRVYPIPLCITQGSLPISERYGVKLPPDARRGEMVEVPLHQQVGENEADRFVIRLGVDANRVGDETGPVAETLGVGASDGSLPGVYLFEVAVSLVHDGEAAPLKMGTALVAAPELPLTSQYLLEEGDLEELTEAFLIDESYQETWGKRVACWRENGRASRRALRSHATRSAQLQETLSPVVVPSLPEVEG